MTESDKDAKKETSQLMPFDNIFGSLRDEIENAMRTWSTSPWIPSLFDYQGIRVPLCEVVDKGNLYELHLELPGVGKENVKVTANSHSIEVSAKKISRIKESQKRRIYTERSEFFLPPDTLTRGNYSTKSQVEDQEWDTLYPASKEKLYKSSKVKVAN